MTQNTETWSLASKAPRNIDQWKQSKEPPNSNIPQIVPTYPSAALDQADAPKQDIDVEEEDDVDKAQRMLSAPFTYSAPKPSLRFARAVVQECPVEEERRDGHNNSQSRIGKIARAN